MIFGVVHIHVFATGILIQYTNHVLMNVSNVEDEIHQMKKVVGGHLLANH